MNSDTMTKNLTIKLLAGLLLSFVTLACAKPFTPSVPEADELVPVMFSADCATKSTGITDSSEDNIARWAVFAFGADGSRSASSSTDATPVVLHLKSGLKYTIAAVVNYPETGPGALNMQAIRTLPDLSWKVALLSDNAPGHLLMYGEDVFVPSPSEPGTAAKSKSINVTRLVSRIEVRRISVDFSSQPSLSGKALLLRRIFITNAYRTTTYGADYTYADISFDRASWYNTMGLHRGESSIAQLDNLLGDLDLDVSISDGDSYAAEHVYYAIPNPLPSGLDSRDCSLWSARCSRLVLECELDGSACYYTVTLPPMKRNVIYSAGNILITGRGASDPEATESTVDPVITYTLEITKSGGSPAGGLKIAAGSSLQLKAILRRFADGVLSETLDVTSSVSWSASSVPEGNASVNSAGVVSGINAGPAIIGAKYSPDGSPELSASVPISVITWSDDWEDDPEIEL